jgi:hypothetical protein
MNNCLVTVADTENGVYIGDWRGLTTAVRTVTSPRPDQGDEDFLRSVQTFACQEEDVNVVVTKMSEWHVGRDIKVFNLTQVFSRLPGELKSKVVTKEGIFPA